MILARAMLLAALFSLAAGRVEAAGLKKGFAMCRDERTLIRLIGASVAKDEASFGALMRDGCRSIRGDERIRVAARGKAVAKLAVQGQRGSWWTVVEALK